MASPILLDTVSLDNERLSLRMLPEQGAKLCSLRDRRSGREWLLPSQLPGGGYLRASYGADFSQYDTSGFDECFPTVTECSHPDDALTWPDHGELWSRPWSVERDGEGLLARIEGQGWPYTFTRRAALDGDSLCLDYSVVNHAERPLHYLWSAHPLLKVTPGMRLLLPDSLRVAYVNGASDARCGQHGDLRPWPELMPGLDFSVVQPVACRQAVKLFFPHLVEGACAIWDPASGDALTFSWDPKDLPHLGLWLCYGGWPEDGRPGQLTVALEPCSGQPDSLREAADQGTCMVLGPGERRSWRLRLRSHTNWQPHLQPGEAP